MLGHIYIGTIGMEGAFEAMGDGTVDENWAKQHHALWLEEEKARTGPPSATPATPALQQPGRIDRPNSRNRSARRSSAGRFCYKARHDGQCASSASPAGAARARPR